MFAYLPSPTGNDGFAVVTDRFVCLLCGDATLDLARSVFWLLDGDDALMEDALGALAQADSVERFAIVEMLPSGDRSMRVAVRGQISVGIEGTMATRHSAPGEATWITGEARGVRSLWLALDEDRPEGEALPLGRGIVSAGAIVADPLSELLFPGAARAREGAPAPTWAADAQSHAEPGAPASDSDAPAEPEAHEEGADAPAEPEADKPLLDLSLEPAPAPFHPVTTQAVPTQARMLVDDAPQRAELDEWINDQGALRWVIELPDGNELDAEGTIVIGRSPSEPHLEENSVRHVSVPSPKKQISGAHLELAVVEGQLVARDLDSTNGTIVLTPERPPRLLHGGRTTSLQTGDILDLGESFRIVVSNRP